MTRPGVSSAVMGTAPAEQQQPAMPDARRLVARSVSVLTRHGMTRNGALAMVVQVATHVHDQLSAVDPEGVSWLSDVVHIAASQLAGFQPSEIE